MEHRKKIKKNRKEKYSLRQTGSLTLECAIVFPLYFLGMILLIGMIDLFRIQGKVLFTLNESAKELGMYAYAVEKTGTSPVGTVTDGACILYTSGKLKAALKEEKTGRIYLSNSGYKDGRIRLKAVYFYKSPFSLFSFWPARLQASVSADAWLGYEASKGEMQELPGDRIVYATEYESVYHRSEDCTHLRLQVTPADRNEVETMKNIYGEKYKPCEVCMGENHMGRLVYIAEKGNRYHSRRDCGALTRHIRLVRERDMTGKEPCSRCGGTEP